MTKDSLYGRVNQLPQSNKLINKINRSKDSFFLIEDTIDMSIIDTIPYIQNSPPSKANDASINSDEIEQSQFYSDKIFEKVKLDRLKTIILESITEDTEVLIRNELLRKKYTLSEISRRIKKWRFYHQRFTSNCKRNLKKSVSVQSITSCMTISEANLVPANNSVAVEDVCNKNNETQITMTKFLFRQKRHKW